MTYLQNTTLVYIITDNKKQLLQLLLGMPASDILRAGLSDLKSLCEHVLVTFEVSKTNCWWLSYHEQWKVPFLQHII